MLMGQWGYYIRQELAINLIMYILAVILLISIYTLFSMISKPESRDHPDTLQVF